MFAYFEEEKDQELSETELQKLWKSKIDHSNFSDYESWKDEMVRMQILLPKGDEEICQDI